MTFSPVGSVDVMVMSLAVLPGGNAPLGMSKDAFPSLDVTVSCGALAIVLKN